MSSDKSPEIKCHDRKVRSNRIARLIKAIIRRDYPIGIQFVDQISASVVQTSSPAQRKKRSLHKDKMAHSLKTILGQGAKPEFPAIDRSRHAFFSGNYDPGNAAKDLRLKLSRALPSKLAKSLLELSFLRSKPA